VTFRKRDVLQRGNWEWRGAGNSRRVKGGVMFCNGLQLVGSMRGRQCRMLNQKSGNSVDLRSPKLMFSSCFSGGEIGRRPGI